VTGDLSMDRGLTLGVGLFETVLALEGRPVLWEAHLARLARGCAALGLPAPAPLACRTAADAALAAAGLGAGRAAVRLTWTGGDGRRGLDAPEKASPRLIVLAAASATPPSSLALEVSGVRRNPSSATSRFKTLSSLDQVTARAEARAAGADEAVMLSTSGEVACAAAGNLLWMTDGVLFTPALACGVLDGIVRGEAMAAARAMGVRVEEVAATLDEMLAADWVAVSNSLIGVVPVSRVGARRWQAPSEETAALIEALKPLEMRG